MLSLGFLCCAPNFCEVGPPRGIREWPKNSSGKGPQETVRLYTEPPRAACAVLRGRPKTTVQDPSNCPKTPRPGEKGEQKCGNRTFSREYVHKSAMNPNYCRPIPRNPKKPGNIAANLEATTSYRRPPVAIADEYDTNVKVHPVGLTRGTATCCDETGSSPRGRRPAGGGEQLGQQVASSPDTLPPDWTNFLSQMPLMAPRHLTFFPGTQADS